MSMSSGLLKTTFWKARFPPLSARPASSPLNLKFLSASVPAKMDAASEVVGRNGFCDAFDGLRSTPVRQAL